MRSWRNSADRTRRAEASGVPYFSVWIMVVTTPLIASSLTRVARFSNAMRRSVRKLRSEEHTSELQSLMRISYAVFCLKQQTTAAQTVSTQNYSIDTPDKHRSEQHTSSYQCLMRI